MIVIGAFLGRSFDFLAFVPAGCDVAVVAGFGCFSASTSDAPAAVGLLFCASPSLSLTPCSCCLCQGVLGGHCVCASAPAMLVSGTPVFRGGGGIFEGRECGRYAVSVIKGRLEDCRRGRNDEKGHRCALRHCAHLLAGEDCEANLSIDCTEGPCVLRAAIAKYGRCRGDKKTEVAWLWLFLARFKVIRSAANWKSKGS